MTLTREPELDPRPLAPGPMDRPIRVILFGGPLLERGFVRFAGLLSRHPEVELTVCYVQTNGLGWKAHGVDLMRRRGLLAIPLAAWMVGRAGARWLLTPRAERRHRRAVAELRERLRAVPDLHAPALLDEVRRLDADLGVIYGGPILRPELFRLPRLGTLGIHHGRLPEYRGKKTTFWEMSQGEETAGVTIQRVHEGIDTGDVVRSAAIPIGGRSYRRVWREVEEVGLGLYLEAVLEVKRGTARARTPATEKRPAFKDPGAKDLLRFYFRRWIPGERRDAEEEHPAGLRRAGIILMTEGYHPMVGGGETQARALASAFTERGRSVLVLTRRWDPDAPTHSHLDDHRIVRVGPSGRGHLKKWGLVFTTLPTIFGHRRTHGTLVVCGFRVMGIPGVFLGRALGFRVLLKADSPGEMSGEFFDPGLARLGLSSRSIVVRAFLALRNRILQRADGFIAISTPLAQELTAHGVAPAIVHRIPNGIDLAHFRPADPDERSALRAELDLPRDGRLVLYVGRLVSYKGLPLLLEAWERVASRHPDARLVLVGSGGADIHACEVELRARAQAEGLRSNVLFAGEVPDAAPWLRAADAFVFPSENEAFGLAVVEAMASGLPVIATRAGGLVDIVSEGRGGIPIPTGSVEGIEAGLERVLGDPEGARALGESARTAAESAYGLDAVAEAYLELIDMERAPRHPPRHNPSRSR